MKRRKFLRWVARTFYKTPEGTISESILPPQFVMWLYYLLFPIEAYYSNQTGFRYDPVQCVWYVNNVKFSYEFVQCLSALKKHESILLSKNDDGTVTVKEYFPRTPMAV